MIRGPIEVPVRYFGKIPTRGDFVKSAGQHQLVASLDQWLAQGMELLAQDARWKLTYESIQPIRFAFMGPRSKFVVAGHLRASADLSQRRFPFLTVAAFESEDPPALITRSPFALDGTWARLESLTNTLFASADVPEALNALGAATVPVEVSVCAGDEVFQQFLERTGVAQASASLSVPGRQISLRRLLLAMGILLQPIMTSGTSQLDKGLLLPLPAEPFYRALYYGLWMRLVTPFLTRSSFELAVFDGTFLSHPALVIGFSGASPRTLQSVFDPQVCAEHNIRIDDAEWIEPYLDNHYGLRKLASYLEQDTLSLKVAIETFDETFLGA